MAPDDTLRSYGLCNKMNIIYNITIFKPQPWQTVLSAFTTLWSMNFLSHNNVSTGTNSHVSWWCYLFTMESEGACVLLFFKVVLTCAYPECWNQFIKICWFAGTIPFGKIDFSQNSSILIQIDYISVVIVRTPPCFESPHSHQGLWLCHCILHPSQFSHTPSLSIVNKQHHQLTCEWAPAHTSLYDRGSLCTVVNVLRTVCSGCLLKVIL